MKRRILSIVMVAAMLLTFIPSAFAAELTITAANGTGGAVILTITTSATYTANDPLYYKVFTEQQWKDAGETWDGQDGKTVAGVSTAGDATTANIASEFGADGKYYVACYDDTSGSGSAEVLPLDIEGKQIKVPKSTITWDLNYTGSTNPTTDQAQGAVVTLPTAPIRTGYSFGGWFKEPACTTALPTTETVPTSAVTYYAKWTANELSMEDSEVSVTYGDTSINAELKKAANGTGTYTYATTDTLPTGLVLDAAGKITGTANAATAAAGVEINVTATDSNSHKTTTAKVTIKVAKATPTGNVKVTEVTEEGKKLTAVVAPEFKGVDGNELPGTLTWKKADGSDYTEAEAEAIDVEEDVVYTWVFTPDDDTNYNTRTGTAKPWAVTAEPAEEHIAYIKGRPADDKGTPFAPDDTLQRNEAAVMIARVTGYNSNETYTSTFEDIGNESAELKNAINYCFTRKLINGRDAEGKIFDPTTPIKRGELAKILAEYVGPADVKDYAETSELKDLENNFYAPWINYLYNHGLVQGRPNGNFDPEENITRAEAVTMINAALGRAQGTTENGKVVTPLNVESPFYDVAKDQWFFNNVMEASNTHLSDSDVYNTTYHAPKG